MSMYIMVSRWMQQYGWVQASVAGVFLGIGFILPALWFLSILAISYMVVVLHTQASTKKIIGMFTYMWCIKSLLSISWFWSAYPISWIEGMSTGVQIALISVYWLTSGLWLASGGALFGYISLWLMRMKRLPWYAPLVLLPVVWLLAELFSAFVFSVFTSGPGSYMQTYFSFGMIGYLLGVTPLGVWFAAFGGVYGLTVVMAGVAVGGYVLLPRVSKKAALVGMVLLYGLCTHSALVPYVVSKTPTTVISVDTEFDAEFLSTIEGQEAKARTLAQAVEAAVNVRPDVIILPEDSRYLSSQFDDGYPNQAMSMFQFTHGNTNAILIDSGRYTTDTGMTVLRANVFDGISKKMVQLDKQYLVPQGEYVPLAYAFVLRALGYGPVVEAVAEDSSYRPGPLLQTRELESYIPGVLFCFESVSPFAARALTDARTVVPFIAHPISHGWFHSPTLLWQQLDVMLRVQARFAQVPIVSAGNMAQGKLYLPSGEVQSGEVIDFGDKYILRAFQF